MRVARAVLLTLLLTAVCVAPDLAAQQEVGQVVELRGRLTETQLWDGATRQMLLEDPVRTGTRLECGTGCRAGLLVNGESAVLKMNESTVIENPIEEAAPRETESSWWRTVKHLTGRIVIFFTEPSRVFSTETPQGDIASRGTGFAVDVDNARTIVWSLEGQIEVSSLAGGPPVVLSAGEMTVVRAGRQPTTPTPFDPKSGATGSGALPPPFDRPPEEEPDPPLFLVPDELPPRRGIDDPNAGGGG